MLIHQVAHPEIVQAFFVRHCCEKHIPGQRDLFGAGFQESRQKHSHAAFHIQRAATPHKAIHDAAFEGRVSPLLAGGGNHIHVTVKQQGRGLAGAFQAGDQVGTPRGARHEIRFYPGLFQQNVNVFDARPLVTGRVGGIKTDQVLKNFGRAFVNGTGWF
jgi:hypothetical protein